MNCVSIESGDSTDSGDYIDGIDSPENIKIYFLKYGAFDVDGVVLPKKHNLKKIFYGISEESILSI